MSDEKCFCYCTDQFQSGPELRGGAWGAVPPQPQYNGSRALPTNKKKKNLFIKFPQNATRIPSGTTPPRDDYRPSTQFLVHVAAMCAAVPPPEIESQLRA